MLLRSLAKRTEVLRIETFDGQPALQTTKNRIAFTLARVFYDLRGVLCETNSTRVVPIDDIYHEYDQVEPYEFNAIRYKD